MGEAKNEHGQPIGRPLPDWKGCPRPTREVMQGRSCRLEPLNASDHAAALHAAYGENVDGSNWTYMPYGPFASKSDYRGFVEFMQVRSDPIFYAIVDRATDRPVGAGSYLRIEPEVGVIEVGHLSYSPALQRTVGGTEAMYLMMRHVFDDLGYRRYEWKCDALNAASRAAAERLGFSYEGTFRQAVLYKGRNRDTAWFSITDGEWPAIKRGLEAWLDVENFDANGAQKKKLGELMPAS
jgi:RimJ/RimL family protein N-acetyltransferase